jgi:hypothetical protein
MELGIGMFGDLAFDAKTGKPSDGRLQEILEEIKLADDIGLDVFAWVSTIRRIMQFHLPKLCLPQLQVLREN